VSRSILTSLAATLAVAAAACGDAVLYPYEPIGATVTCPDTMVGYAAVGDVDGGAGPTTGGDNSPAVTVNNVADFVAEVQSLEPRVILLDGMLAPTETIKVTLDRNVRGGNKTIIGLGAGSGLTGAGLDLSYADNVKVRNLKISKASIGEGDAITLLASHHIWIDHCDLSSDRDDTTSGYDGLVDITHGSSDVTVSWTQFHDHKDTSIVGHTDNIAQMAEDSELSVTYHHNLFLNVNSGPRIRFGRAHVFSNHFQHVTEFGVAAESFAGVLVDHNVFDDVSVPITTMFQDPTGGTMTETSNKFPAGSVHTVVAAAPPIGVPYAYSSDSADSVSAVVATCAGTGKIKLP
jgi:pectate lyase